MTTPFIKWVGGKRQLLPELDRLITKKCLTYYEPFLGGGAPFFHFTETARFRKAVLNDVNPELINCYEVVRDRPEDLILTLDSFLESPDWNTSEYYYNMRALEPTASVIRAARFVYLNKTCFNGMHRVNKSGKFNVPFGKYKNPKLYDRETLLSCSEVLKKYATLRCGSFEDAVKDAGPGDLVYFDPPYVPVSETSNFTSYAGEFVYLHQQKLASLYRELYNRGVMVVLSNSDTPLIHELYSGFDVHIVGAKRSINSKGDGRGKVNEVVVVGIPDNLKIDVSADTYTTPDFPLECAACGNDYTSSDIACTTCGSTRTE